MSSLCLAVPEDGRLPSGRHFPNSAKEQTVYSWKKKCICVEQMLIHIIIIKMNRCPVIIPCFYNQTNLCHYARILQIYKYFHTKKSTEKMMNKLSQHNKACNLKLPDTESTDQGREHDE